MDQKKRVGVGFGVLMLNEQNEILLGLRHADPAKADSELHGENTWTMPGGKLEFGETFEEGAAREVMEETGMTLHSAAVICVQNDKVSDAHFVTIGLFSKDFSGTPRVMEPDEITQWKWWPMDALPERMYFPSTRILENYKAGKFYIRR